VPQCLDFGKSKDGNRVCMLLSWIDGEEAEKVLPNIKECEKYRYGVQAGSILRKTNENSQVRNSSKNWYERYFAVMNPRLEAFRSEECSRRVLETVCTIFVIQCSHIHRLGQVLGSRLLFRKVVKENQQWKHG